MMILIALFLLIGVSAPGWAGFDTAGGTSNEHWVISDNAVLDNPDSDWTYAIMWRNDAGPGGIDRWILGNQSSSGTNPAFVIYCSNSSGPGNIVMRNNDDATNDQIAVSSGQECNAAGGWQRLIVQHTGNVITGYLDNVSIFNNTTAGVGASSGPAGGLFVGIRPDTGSEHNQATCDFAKWSRLLTASERASLNFTSAAMFPQSQQFFIPGVREFIETRVPLTVTNSGSTIVDCPRLFRPN